MGADRGRDRRLTSARSIAVEVLARVETGGSYSDLLLNARLAQTPDMGEQDRRLAKELVFGVLRRKTLLDYYLNQCGTIDWKRTDPSVAAALRAGAYQILFLDKVPDFAAVKETVETIVKMFGAPKARFVNALLRKLSSQKARLEQPRLSKSPGRSELIRHLALVHSFPALILERWRDHHPSGDLKRLLEALNEVPSKVVRVNVAKASLKRVRELLRQEGFETTESEIAPHALRLDGHGSPEGTQSWESGQITVQDESSQVIAHVVDGLQPKTILDAFAGIGQKLGHLAELFPGSTVIGTDLHLRKANMARAQMERLGLDNVRLLAADSNRSPFRQRQFDLVLVDAPCTGTGTIRHHPEIRYRVSTHQVRKMERLQRRLLETAASLVAPNGHLIYSTCSLEEEENEDVVRFFLDRNSHFALVDLTDLPKPLMPHRSQFGVRTRPHVHDCDGMFFSLMRRGV